MEQRAHDDYSSRLQAALQQFRESLEKPDDFDCDCRYRNRGYYGRRWGYDDDDDDDDEDCECWKQSDDYASVQSLLDVVGEIIDEIKDDVDPAPAPQPVPAPLAPAAARRCLWRWPTPLRPLQRRGPPG